MAFTVTRTIEGRTEAVTYDDDGVLDGDRAYVMDVNAQLIPGAVAVTPTGPYITDVDTPEAVFAACMNAARGATTVSGDPPALPVTTVPVGAVP